MLSSNICSDLPAILWEKTYPAGRYTISQKETMRENVCMYVHCEHVWCSEGISCPGTGATMWVLGTEVCPGRQKDQQVLLDTESSSLAQISSDLLTVFWLFELKKSV